MAVELTIKNHEYIFSGNSLSLTKDKNTLLLPYGKMLHLYGQVLELLPDKDEASFFRQNFGCSRLVANDYLEKRSTMYKEQKQILSVAAYKKTTLNQMKAEKPFLRAVDKFALENALKHVDDAFKNMYEGRAKFPKPVSRRKPNGNRYTTNITNNNIHFLERNGHPCIKLPKLKGVRFILPKGMTMADLLPRGARITKATVSMRDGRFFVSLSIEMVIDLITDATEVSVSEILSGDAGLHEFLIYGGESGKPVHVENPRWIKKHERRLRRFQKMLSRRQYDTKTHTGSKRWEKARLLVSKEQLKTANQRKDFQHVLSSRIAKQCTVFIKEDLNIEGMKKNRRLAKAVASVGWGGFFEKLAYKLKRKGGFVVSVGRFYPSSQLCFHCGYQNPELKNLKIRHWICPVCGAAHDRDENAQRNIWAEGVRIMKEQGITILDNQLAKAS